MPNTRKIKARMAELGITQTELAGKIGISSAAMCQKINNIRPFSLHEAEVVAGVLGIKDSDFGVYFFAGN